MREIKFRAWSKGSKIMSYEPMQETDGPEYTTLNDNIKYGYEFGCYDELMQFTGLKDKNGKEIYEGDIVKSPKKVYQVVWNQECARWGLKNRENYPVSIHGTGQTLEVIGNIYENSELFNDLSKEEAK